MIPAFLIPALLGGGLGLLTNKKDPFKGALLGAGLGAAGGLLGPAIAPAMSGGSAIGGSALAAEAAALGVPAPGLSGMGTLSQTLGQLKPVGDAIGTGLQVANSFDKPQNPITPSPMIQYQSGNQTMDGLLGNIQNQSTMQMEEERRKREARRMLLRGGS